MQTGAESHLGLVLTLAAPHNAVRLWQCYTTSLSLSILNHTMGIPSLHVRSAGRIKKENTGKMTPSPALRQKQEIPSGFCSFLGGELCLVLLSQSQGT